MMPARYYPVILYWLCFLGLIIWAISHDIQNSLPTQLPAHNNEGQPNQTQNTNQQINSSTSGIIRFTVEFGKTTRARPIGVSPIAPNPKITMRQTSASKLRWPILPMIHMSLVESK